MASASSSSSVVSENTRNAKRRTNKVGSKKITEVKEVIQNRSDNDIQTVLEHYDFNVANTINAFMNDDAREILNKKKNVKVNGSSSSSSAAAAVVAAADNQNNNNVDTTTASETTGAKTNNRKPKNIKLDKNNNLNNNTKINSFNGNNNNRKTSSFDINDLVESIVSKHINPNESTIQEQQQHVSSSNSSAVISNILEKLNKTNVTSQQQQQQQQLNDNNRPSSLDFNKNNSKQAAEASATAVPDVVSKRYIPTQNTVINMNAKKILEKSQKDLQRQIVSLSKLNVNFDEEIDKTKSQLSDLFSKLRRAIDEREKQLQDELEKSRAQGNELFANRQKKANEFKIASDNCDYLSEAQTQDLKNDIKNFVSERKLDEELGMAKRFVFDNYEKVEQSLRTFGQIVQINTNHYTNGNSPEANTPVSTPVATAAQPANSKATADAKVMKALNAEFDKVVKITSDTVAVAAPPTTATVNGYNNKNEQFIEAKKPQRNRNNKQTVDQPQAAAVKVNGNGSIDDNVPNGEYKVVARRNNRSTTAAAGTTNGVNTRTMNGVDKQQYSKMNGNGLNGHHHNGHQSSSTAAAKVNGN